MAYPQRKPTRLPGYDYSQSGALDAPRTRLSALGVRAEQCILSGNHIPGVRVDKYVIMPNHIHILLFVQPEHNALAKEPANATIPHFVSTFKRFCRKDANVPIFQRSYHDHIIRDEGDYLRIWQYIDNNPALWEEDCFYNSPEP